MNYEEARLNTFYNWPISAQVEPIRIAKAGFYYTGQGLEVQCFSCGGKISDWNYGDQVMARHIRLDPDCPFVTNPQGSGNVVLILGHSSTTSNVGVQNSPRNNADNLYDHDITEEDEMHKNDALRLLSYINWPVPFITRESMVNAGLYHSGDGRSRCAWCGTDMPTHWQPGDDPLRVHFNINPNCIHARILLSNQMEAGYDSPSPDSPHHSPNNFDNPREQQEMQQTDGVVHNERVLSSGTTWRTLGVTGAAEGARHSMWASLTSRINSFQTWPENLIQTPETLAEAGFYYTGEEDRVRCFYCDGGLGSWEAGDTPWTEHAHWFPHCGYVLLMKGKAFIDQCRNRSNVQTTAERGSISRSRQNRHSEENIGPPVVALVDRLMEQEVVQAVLAAGLDAARVRRAVAGRLRATGIPFSSSEALIDVVLSEQLAEEAWDTETFTPDEFMTRFYGTSSQDSESDDSREPTPIPPPVTNFRVRDLSNLASMALGDCRPRRHSSEVSNNSTVQEPVSVSMAPSQSLATENHNDPPIEVKHVSLEEENRQLKEARLCKVCMDNEVSIVFLPCGHLVSCARCGAALAACPLCRGKVLAFVRAYLS